MRLTLLVDPRFSGGTSSAVAREISALASVSKLSVRYLRTRMFKGDTIHPKLAKACAAEGVSVGWAEDTISADVIVLHNPSCLKFNTDFPHRLQCQALYLVAHESFLRPGPSTATAPEAFAVRHCLDLLQRNAITGRRIIAPISPNNRDTVVGWIDRQDLPVEWEVDPVDWPNICDFEMQRPVPHPRDRRGRHSRPGFEKFPLRPDLERMFPPHAEAVRILGADSLLLESDLPPQWDCVPFMGEPVDRFLESIDFFVYFTNPCWRESFGRVLAEAIAAGKVVITDPVTARTFGKGVIGCTPDQVDAIISDFIQKPRTYAAQVKRGQAALQAFGSDAFRNVHDQRMKTMAQAARSEKETLYALL